jgi:segregation and condensation protein B
MEIHPIGGNIWKRSNKASPASDDYLEVRNIVEALLFVSDEPLPVKKIMEVVEAEASVITDALADLQQEMLEDNRGIQLREIGDGWKLHSHPAYADYIQRLMLSERRGRLTRAAIETLAIIAYMQPITRTQIAAIRGIQSESVVKVLESYELVREAGKESAPGGPVLYETTPEFLEQFGLKTIEDLPPLETFEPDETTIEQIKRSLLPPDAEAGEAGETAQTEETPYDLQAEPEEGETIWEGEDA